MRWLKPCWAVVLLCGLALRGETLPQTGGREGDFLAWGSGARALGLGKAYVALAADATASYWNPAGLAFADVSEVTALHAMMWEGVSYDFLSLALPTVTAGTFGWFANVLSAGGVERRDDENNLVEGNFGLTKAGAGMAYGLHLLPDWAVGVSVKWLGRWMDGRSTGFVTADLGTRWIAWPGCAVGVVVQHAAAARYGDTEDQLPGVLRVGLALSPWPEWGVVVADIERTLSGFGNSDPLRWRIGMESGAFGPFTARLGLDTWEAAGGVGFRYEGLSLDYSGAMHADLGLSHRVSVGTQWGDRRFAVRQASAREAYRRALDAWKKAEDAGLDAPESLPFLELAKSALQDVLAYDGENLAAKRWLNRLQKP